jgi:uncharacterized membrane protein
MESEKIRHYLATYAVSFIFIIFGIWEIINPQYWAGFVPSFVSRLPGSANFLVQIHGIVLAAAAISLAFDFKRKIAAALGTLMMLGIVISLYIDSGFSTLLIRDIAITLFVASLFFDDYKERIKS